MLQWIGWIDWDLRYNLFQYLYYMDVLKFCTKHSNDNVQNFKTIGQRYNSEPSDDYFNRIFLQKVSEILQNVHWISFFGVLVMTNRYCLK